MRVRTPVRRTRTVVRSRDKEITTFWAQFRRPGKIQTQDLRGLDFSGCDFEEATFDGVAFERAKFDHAKLAHARRAHARRSPPLLLGPGRAAADDARFLPFSRPAEPLRLSTASGQTVSVVREPGVGPLRLSIGLPDGALTVFAYPAHGVAWVQASTPTALARGLYPLRLGAASLAIGPLRLWFAPATHDVSADGVDPSRAIYEATDEVRDGNEPMRGYLAAGATLFWPLLTAHGVSCVPHELRGASGSVVLESGQDRHEHRYTQNELGIELDPVPCVSYYPRSAAYSRSRTANRTTMKCFQTHSRSGSAVAGKAANE
jgi:hypothetical protein